MFGYLGGERDSSVEMGLEELLMVPRLGGGERLESVVLSMWEVGGGRCYFHIFYFFLERSEASHHLIGSDLF
jgi:hypothetical protein